MLDLLDVLADLLRALERAKARHGDAIDRLVAKRRRSNSILNRRKGRS